MTTKTNLLLSLLSFYRVSIFHDPFPWVTAKTTLILAPITISVMFFLMWLLLHIYTNSTYSFFLCLDPFPCVTVKTYPVHVLVTALSNYHSLLVCQCSFDFSWNVEEVKNAGETGHNSLTWSSLEGEQNGQNGSQYCCRHCRFCVSVLLPFSCTVGVTGD